MYLFKVAMDEDDVIGRVQCEFQVVLRGTELAAVPARVSLLSLPPEISVSCSECRLPLCQ